MIDQSMVQDTASANLPTRDRLAQIGLARTHHFSARQSQRGIRDHVVALAVGFGRRFREGGDTVFFLGRRDLPRGIEPQLADRANGTTVIVASDGTLVTTFRNPEFCKTLRRRK